MEYYLTNPKGKHIKEYVSIISGSPVYPIIYDNKQRVRLFAQTLPDDYSISFEALLMSTQVLSLPPIINSEHSKISLKTKNIFIECTATDLFKVSCPPACPVPHASVA